jgi:hypothetical protein
MCVMLVAVFCMLFLCMLFECVLAWGCVLAAEAEATKTELQHLPAAGAWVLMC